MESVLVIQENNAMAAAFEANEAKIHELTDALQGRPGGLACARV